MDNIIISNTTQDVELASISNTLSTDTANITTLGALATTANANALAALNLANNKQFILFSQKPLQFDISNNLYLS